MAPPTVPPSSAAAPAQDAPLPASGAGTIGAPPAGDAQSSSPASAPARTAERAPGPLRGPAASLRAWLDARVDDRDGALLGHIDDVLADSDSGRLAYAVLAGDDGQRLAVPWRALRRAKDGALSVALAKGDAAALVVDPQFWPGLSGDERWARQLHERFAVAPYWEGAATTREEA